MKIKDFGVEMWMNAYENDCTYNLAETCVESLTVEQLLELGGCREQAVADILGMKLTYGAIEGSPRLRMLIAGLYEKQTPENVITAHGAIGANHLVIEALAGPGDEVVSVLPTYQQHYSIPEALGAEVHILPLRSGNAFLPDLDELRGMVNKNTKLICINNPNNPTGLTLSPALLREIYAACVSIGAYLVVDECFNDFLTDAAAHTVKHLLPCYPKLIILRAFTKMYAIPGVRLGYCMCADPACIEALRQAGQPWNVSVIAQACGVAAAGLQGFAQQTARRIAEERGFLAQALRRRGLTVFDGQANFLLWKTRDTALHQKLEGKGVLIRDCSNYRGLAPGFYRTAVKQREDSLRFLRALDDIL